MTTCLRLADIDGDQDLDIITGYSSNVSAPPSLSPVTVRRNNGTGGYGAPTPLLGANLIASAFDVGDVDNDGDLDLVGAVVDFAGLQPASSVWLNNGTGQFTPGGYLASPTGMAYALGDVDGDGDLDLANGFLRLNDGHGNFYGSAVVGADGVRGNALVDLNGDGALDLVNASDQAQEFTRYLNDGTGTFSPGVTLARNWNDNVLLRDLDGDGDADFVPPSASFIMFNDGTGTFTAGPFFTFALSGERIISAGDVDGDGDVDLLTNSRVLLNNGLGGFQPGVSFTAYAPQTAVMGDIDGDGDLDMVIAVDNRTGIGGWSVHFNGSTTSAAALVTQIQPVRAWPTPLAAGSLLHLSLPTGSSATVTLRTVLGQLSRSLVVTGSSPVLTTDGLAPGVYLLTLEQANQQPSVVRVVSE